MCANTSDKLYISPRRRNKGWEFHLGDGMTKRGPSSLKKNEGAVSSKTRTTHPCLGFTSCKYLLCVFLLLSVVNNPTPAAALLVEKDNNVADGKFEDSAKRSARKLYDSGEHFKAGEQVLLPFPDKNWTGRDKIFSSVQNTFSFGQLTYLTGDVLGPFYDNDVICSAKNYDDRRSAAIRMMEAYDDEFLASSERISRAQAGVDLEVTNAASTNVTFQKHVQVHNTSYEEFNKIDEIEWEKSVLANCALGGPLSTKNTHCMISVNYDHFGDCAKRTYQILHDLALENASSGDADKLKLAYFYEGLSSHSLTDLFSAGHIRNPSKRLRGSHCSDYRGGVATVQMHDEDSYNGLLMTNRINSKAWWVFGDSFYFEECNDDNRQMIGQALQESINEVYAAFQSKNQDPGHSNPKDLTNYPGKALDYVPDMEISKANIPNFWDVNTCPMWYDNPKDGKMYRRFPWYRLRSAEGRKMTNLQPSSNKFGLFPKTFPLVEDEDQLQVYGEPDLEEGGCWFKHSPETVGYSDECWEFGTTDWDAAEMFYSPEAAGFMPPTLATCQAYTLGGRNEFDNDCYDVLELVSKGQNCANLTDYETCGRLSPRCTWNDGWGPDAITGGTCVQGSCVAFSTLAGDIVSGDPTPPAPPPPDGFYMSFQGSCAFGSLNHNDYKQMPGRNNIAKCSELCLGYTGTEGRCTGIAVDSGIFGDCYLYFNNSCKRADGPGFSQCASHGLQTYHRGAESMESIMEKCECKSKWYYKDPNDPHEYCESVEAASWGSWCYVADPENCTIAMHSSSQPDQGWRYCKESTCENYPCPNGLSRRDSVVCYDDSCNDLDCCIGPPLMCSDITNGWQCTSNGCAWQDGYVSDACKEGICKNWYNRAECESNDCSWIDAWGPDYCDSSRRLGEDHVNEDAVSALLKDPDFIKTMVDPPGGNTEPVIQYQAKLNAMHQGMKKLTKDAILFFALDDGTYYSLKSCTHGPSCWAKYVGAEYTFGIVEPSWSEYINIFKVVAGKIDFTNNRFTESGVPNFAEHEYNPTQEMWYGKTGWSAPFTSSLMHPDEAEINQVYTVVGPGYTIGAQVVSSDKKPNSPSPKPKDNKAKSGKKGKSSKSVKEKGKKDYKSKSGKKG